MIDAQKLKEIIYVSVFNRGVPVRMDCPDMIRWLVAAKQPKTKIELWEALESAIDAETHPLWRERRFKYY